MNLKRIFSLITLWVLIVSAIAAQTPSPQDSKKADETKADQEKARQALDKKAIALLDEVLKETPNLKLAENRIRIQAMAADLLWKSDEKRARALFKQATDAFAGLPAGEGAAGSSQFASAAGRFSTSPVKEHPGLVMVRYQIRQEIMQLLTNHDAKLAREFLRAISGPVNGESTGYGGMGQDAITELALAAQMAATDPGQALEIAEDHLEKGFPYELGNVLSQLQNKDAEAAVKLVAEIMKRLRPEDLAKNGQAAMLAILLLRMEGEASAAGSSIDGARNASKVRPILDESSKRELIGMLVNAALNQPLKKAEDAEGGEQNNQPLIASFEEVMSNIERHAPARLPALRNKIAEYESTLPRQTREYKKYGAIMQGGNPQAMIDAAAKASPDVKDTLLMQAIMNLTNEGNPDRARQIINEHIKDAGRRKELLKGIDSYTLQGALMNDKLDEARQMLSQLTSEERLNWLTQYSGTVMGKGNKKLALQIMDEARGLVGPQAENYPDLNALQQLARSYSYIEPSRSFDIIEPIVEQLNVLLSALVTIDGFESWQQFKDGELIGIGPSLIVNTTTQCASLLALISRADFDRAKAAADRFNRNEVRMTARLFVVQGVLSNQ